MNFRWTLPAEIAEFRAILAQVLFNKAGAFLPKKLVIYFELWNNSLLPALWKLLFFGHLCSRKLYEWLKIEISPEMHAISDFTEIADFRNICNKILKWILENPFKQKLQKFPKSTTKLFKWATVNPRSLGSGGGANWPPSIFLALNFCSLTDYQKLWYSCSLFVNTSFDTN